VTARSAVGASVDLGSNSVHLLVASIAGHELEPLVDESVFLGLGAAVDQAAHLGDARRAALVEALVRYAATARQAQARHITLMGTEPIRRAADNATIVADVEHATGVPLHVLSHEEEAYLTLIGVTSGLPVVHETLVVDVGGGSSEFCAVAAGGIARAAGLQLGSNRLSAGIAIDDPPTAGQLASMAAAADAILRDALPSAPTDLVLVGGTASNLLKVTSAGTAERGVGRERVAEALATLAAMPAAETAERFAVNPTRARLMPAGAVIVDALMRHYRVEDVRVSEAGMREGAILVAEHAGRAWRDRLPVLAHGWRH